MEHLSLRSYGASRGSHAHPFFQVLIGLEGSLEIEVQGRGRRIGVGQGCVVPPGARHDFEAASGSQCLVLDSDSPTWARCTALPRPRPPLQALAGYLAGVLAAADGDQYQDARRFGPLLLREAWSPGQPASRHGRQIDWNRLGAWAATHWQFPLVVADLAARVHLSSTQFNLRCRLETGHSPMQWLRLQRLAHARQLQAHGCSVAESARRSGYRSPSALTAAMRRDLPAG